jgi:hypothetical protein
MTRQQLEHILRAAAGITGADQFVVIGSQAILALPFDLPPECVESIEADVFTFRSTEDADVIDGSIGEKSPFHTTFGYYAHGVAEETAVLPAGWKDRLIPLQTPSTGGATGLCLEAHDLAVSKLVAGREKDLSFVSALMARGLLNRSTVESRLAATTLSPAMREVCFARLRALPGQSA